MIKFVTCFLQVLWYPSPIKLSHHITIILFEDTKGVIRSLKLLKKDRQYNDQKLEDTKGIIRRCKLKDRQHNGQKLEDTKGVIRRCKLKDRQYNGQKKKDKHYTENYKIHWGWTKVLRKGKQFLFH